MLASTALVLSFPKLVGSVTMYECVYSGLFSLFRATASSVLHACVISLATIRIYPIFAMRPNKNMLWLPK